MQTTSDRMLLLIDLRDIVQINKAIEPLNKSIELLQNEIDKHPASKYKNYRPKTSSERQKMWETNEDLGKIVGPQHKIMTFKKYLEKKQDELKEALKNKTGKSFEEHMMSLNDKERKLIYSSDEEIQRKQFDIEYGFLNSSINGYEPEDETKDDGRMLS